jgi:hypothetical protein
VVSPAASRDLVAFDLTAILLELSSEESIHRRTKPLGREGGRDELPDDLDAGPLPLGFVEEEEPGPFERSLEDVVAYPDRPERRPAHREPDRPAVERLLPGVRPRPIRMEDATDAGVFVRCRVVIARAHEGPDRVERGAERAALIADEDHGRTSRGRGKPCPGGRANDVSGSAVVALARNR